MRRPNDRYLPYVIDLSLQFYLATRSSLAAGMHDSPKVMVVLNAIFLGSLVDHKSIVTLDRTVFCQFMEMFHIASPPPVDSTAW